MVLLYKDRVCTGTPGLGRHMPSKALAGIKLQSSGQTC